MTATTRYRRMEAVKLTDVLNAIEVLPVPDYAHALSDNRARGELTGEQVKMDLLSSHRKLAEQ